MSASASAPARSASAFSPFGHSAFALLWTATLVSNTGTWMHEVGAGWLMTTLNPTPSVVTLVQAATTLPVFCFALLAGALADRWDKRRMLIVINVILATIVATLALLVWQEKMTPALLIAFTLAIGTGAAFMAPAWQAVVPQLVPRPELKPAIALNSMGINISRAIGPALAGVLIASVGLAAPFALNALSYLVILAALILWKPSARPVARSRPPLVAEMTTGLRHVRHNQAMVATLVRAFAFFIFASAYWALLPLIARNAKGGGAELYGMLMALIGGGAVLGALLLPRLGKSLTSDHIVRLGSVGTAAALITLAAASSAPFLMTAALLGGMSWIAVLTSFNVSAQTALPDWVRARGIAVFLMVFFGAMALGSLVWGQSASLIGTQTTLILAALGLTAAIPLTRKFRVGQGETQDLSPAHSWPDAPVLTSPDHEDRATRVLVEYLIAPQDRARFLNAIYGFAPSRLRDGAYSWTLFESVETPNLWIESFDTASWSEHLAQHDRLSQDDAKAQSVLQAFDQRADGPVVRHFIAPE